MILNNVYHYFSRDLGLVWRAYGDKEDTVGTDTYLGFDISRVAKVDYVGWNDVSFNGTTTYTGFITITYNDNTTRNVFLYNNVVVKDVKWNSGVTTVADLKDLTTSGIDVFNSSDVQIFKIVNKEILIADGKDGSYTGEYGNIVCDGYGTATIGETSFAYTCSDNVISFVYNHAMRSVTLADDASYVKALDKYQGTYTLPDATGTLTLDGYGNAGDGKTYVVKDTTITIYESTTATNYGIDVESKTFTAKSKFAGLTFSSEKYQIVFNDDVTTKGKLSTTGYPKYEYGFTAALKDNTLTITIITENYKMENVDKTITATVSAGGLTFTSSFKIDNVDDINGTTATCTDFVG